MIFTSNRFRQIIRCNCQMEMANCKIQLRMAFCRH